MSRPALSGQASILYSKIFEQSATEKNHLQCNGSTINNLILKFCPKFQVLSFFWGWWLAWRESILQENTFSCTFLTLFTSEKCAKRKYFLVKPQRSEDVPEMVHLGFEGLSDSVLNFKFSSSNISEIDDLPYGHCWKMCAEKIFH